MVTQFDFDYALCRLRTSRLFDSTPLGVTPRVDSDIWDAVLFDILHSGVAFPV